MGNDMKRRILFLLVAVFLVQGCITVKKEPYQALLEKRAAEKVAYDQYKARNTIEGYKEFIQNYPDSMYVHSANADIDGILFRPYLKMNSTDGYNEFINKYPNNENVDIAKRKIERFAFDSFEEQDTIEGYKQYLLEYPKGIYECDAKERLHELEFRKLDNELKSLIGFDLLLYRLSLKRLQRKLHAQGEGALGDFKLSTTAHRINGKIIFTTRLLYRNERTPANIQSRNLTNTFFDAFLENALDFLHRNIKKKNKVQGVEFDVTAAPFEFCKPPKSVVRYFFPMKAVASLMSGDVEKGTFKRKYMVPANTHKPE
jgi:hypothetical protein